jgi:hypothetical protein
MRQTTKKLLDRLDAANPGVYPVDLVQAPGGREVIHLHGDYVLAIDEDAARSTVSLDERTPVGGNVQVASWVVHEDVMLDEIVATSLAMRAFCCRK